MQFVSATVLLAILISGIKTEAEPLTGTLGGPNAYKDGSLAHDYIQAFHHGGQHHSVGGVGSGVSGGGVSDGSSSSSGAIGHPVLSSQIQDQSGLGVVPQDQASHGSAVPPHVVGGPIVAGPSYYPHKSEVAALHLGARAIGSPFPYYPSSSYYGKTYASPYYSQYQPTPYQGVYQSPQSFYPYQYSASPYTASATGGFGVQGAGGALPYSATPYSSPVTPYSAYPYNYPYIPQYYPGYPSAAVAGPSGSYYQSSAAEIQNASKQ
ncbi:uncharacterized protein LOC135834885 [Planococcus citri]|uniref:uncharacterized protein LOC135834885 n=1 Tax=Planococcus citri TaxID=170843 RepID=UPI0031F73E19